MPRLRAPDDPIALTFDGEPIVAQRGEPAAASLVAAGHLTLARSPKFHRPRGPSCLRGSCDGCLARVDGVPNVMTCRTPAADGMRIETQNVLGSRDADWLRMTDWLFPEGMNHHELFAGVPGVQRVMQAMARRVAGLGRLPADLAPPRPAERRAVDVLVVGTGPAGMAAGVELSRRGRRVEWVDEDLRSGGSVRALPGDAFAPWVPIFAAFESALRSDRGLLRLRTTAAGIYGPDVLLAGEEGVSVVTARTLVLAPGAHDGVALFEGNDLPGVISARAACRLLSHGVLPGADILVVATPESAALFAEAYVQAVPGTTFVRGVPVRVGGRSRVRGATVVTEQGEREFRCDALVVDAPGAPAYELCAQAGAELAHETRGFVVKTKAGGALGHFGHGHGHGHGVGARVVAIGEVTGTSLEPGALMQEVLAILDSE